ncbi:MAG: 6-pyruvoyl-tetrahydropterin synthase-related protein [Candidatus Nanohaloarchaea archaeon]
MKLSGWDVRPLLIALLVAAVLGFSHASPMPLSYDFGGHISRVYILVHDGLGWTDMWYNGHPFLHFYPPLYYLLMAPFAYLSFELVRPLSFAFVGFVSFTSMYYYSRERLGESKAIASGILFLSGWLMYIAHISGSLPQALAAALAPAFFAELREALGNGSPVPAGVLAAAMVLLHHNAAVVVAIGVAVYLFMNREKNVLNAALSGATGFFLAGVWLLPALLEFGSSSYAIKPNITIRGVLGVVGPMIFFSIPLVLKAAASLDSVRRYRTETALAVTGIVLSLGVFTVLTQHVPLLARLPPYRSYLLAAFATSFLVAGSRKKILVPVLVVCVFLSAIALPFHDDRGMAPGQQEAYNYLATTDAELVYDAEDTDLRAYALAVHGKDIADGWSLGSTALKPGLKRFEVWQREKDKRAVDFLQRWSVDYVVTYRNDRLDSNLHQMVNSSGKYSVDRCFEKTCIFQLEEPLKAVLSQDKGAYTVNTSKPLPVPYSGHFDTGETELGFVDMEGEGVQKLEYGQKPVHMAGLVASVSTAVIALALYLSGFVLPGFYSKRFQEKMGVGCAG